VLFLVTHAGFAQLSPVRVSIFTQPDGSKRITQSKPDQGEMEERIEDEKGRVLNRAVHKLDQRGLPVSTTYFDGKGNARYVAALRRDSADRIVEETYSSPTGASLGRCVNYWEGNRLIRVDSFNAAGNYIPWQVRRGQSGPVGLPPLPAMASGRESSGRSSTGTGTTAIPRAIPVRPPSTSGTRGGTIPQAIPVPSGPRR
jgi:hypothetical protein